MHVGLDKNDLDIIEYKLQESCNLVKSLNLKVAVSKFLRLRKPLSKLSQFIKRPKDNE